MSLKEFLKPTLRKFLVFVVITVLFLYLYSVFEKINRDVCKPSGQFPFITFVGGLCDYRLLPFLIVFNPVIGFTRYVQGIIISPVPDFAQISSFNFIDFISLTFIHAILTLPYYYVISCLFVWVYDRLRKKQKLK